MARTAAVFEWVFGLDLPATGPAEEAARPYALTFLATADCGLAPAAVAARAAREAASADNVRTVTPPPLPPI